MNESKGMGVGGSVGPVWNDVYRFAPLWPCVWLSDWQSLWLRSYFGNISWTAWTRSEKVLFLRLIAFHFNWTFFLYLYIKEKIDFNSETLAIISPAAAAASENVTDLPVPSTTTTTTQSSKKEQVRVVSDVPRQDLICDTAGCVLAGKRLLKLEPLMSLIESFSSCRFAEEYGSIGGSLRGFLLVRLWRIREEHHHSGRSIFSHYFQPA